MFIKNILTNINQYFKILVSNYNRKKGTGLMMKLTENKVRKIFYEANQPTIKEFTDLFNENADLFGIDQEVHMNFFLAQMREEVGITLKPRRENLNYSCHALKLIFGYYKKHKSEAVKDGRCNGHKANQVLIGNKVYANRLGNGNISSGDGYRFRGGGYIQLTGRDNYMASASVITMALGEVYTPEELESKITTVEGALLTALSFWSMNKLYNCKTIDEVTAKVNKHTDSYERRKKHYKFIASL
jgi:putative chitinase